MTPCRVPGGSRTTSWPRISSVTFPGSEIRSTSWAVKSCDVFTYGNISRKSCERSINVGSIGSNGCGIQVEGAMLRMLREVRVAPPDLEHAATFPAPQRRHRVRQTRPIAAARAHSIAGTPAHRERAGVGRPGHDGPHTGGC